MAPFDPFAPGALDELHYDPAEHGDMGVPSDDEDFDNEEIEMDTGFGNVLGTFLPYSRD